MKYVGLQEQISKNTRKSILLLLAFPLLVLVLVFAFFFILNFGNEITMPIDFVFQQFLEAVPIVLIAVGIWFAIAYFFNASIINATAQSHTLSRKENMRVYNLTENLCMSIGMTMPMLRIIESDGLNAFASGINDKTYTVTLTRGIIDTLEDDELEGVIAHELMHIRNHDVKLLIVSIIFVGIFSFIMQIAYRSIYYGSLRKRNNDKGGGAALIIIVLVLAAVAYFLSFLFKMSLSRKREFLADAGAAEMTRKPWALANALAKISGNSTVEEVESGDVKQMFIENKIDDSLAFLGGVGNIFATHPPIQKRIDILRNF
ncbi:MAG TPA: M48 family metallopeptidase [Brumimicrobium sp.]|nr:M48 family metallopeptidase [Brumimicrobium sp.]